MPPWFAAVLVGGAALVCVGASWRAWFKARRIEDIPTSKIRSAAQGYTELTGFARPGSTPLVTGRLTGTPCLWYRYRVERYQSRKNGGDWTTVDSGSSQADFLLDDHTGQCFILPAGAEFQVAHRLRWRGDSRWPTSVPARTGGPALFARGRYRYTEERLHDGDWLYALGLFQTVHAPSAGEQADSRTRQLLNEWKQDHAQLLARFDHNQDGEIDLAEWEQARADAAAEAHYHVVRHYDDTPIHTLARPPSRSQPFLISSTDPTVLVRRYRRNALLLLVAAAFAVWMTAHIALTQIWR